MSNVQDGLLHIPMGAGIAMPIAAAAFALGVETYPTVSLWLFSGALIVYLREVTQAQMKRKLETGEPYKMHLDWDIWNQSFGKQIETWIAVVPLMVGAVIAGVLACQP